jgi:hypothetical protein
MRIRSDKEKELASKTTGIQIFKNSTMEIQDDEGATDDVKMEDGEEVNETNEIVKNDQFFKYDGKDDGKLLYI